MSTTRVTVTLDSELVEKAREASGRHLSRIVSTALTDHFEAERRRRLREDLIQGCIEGAELDLEICKEWEAIDFEMMARIPWDE